MIEKVIEHVEAILAHLKAHLAIQNPTPAPRLEPGSAEPTIVPPLDGPQPIPSLETAPSVVEPEPEVEDPHDHDADDLNAAEAEAHG